MDKYISVGGLDVGMRVVLPDEHHRGKHAGKSVVILDYTRVQEYGDASVYAYGKIGSKEFLGLLNEGLLPDGGATELKQL